MSDYYKRVYAKQFLLTREQKDAVMKGGEVKFEGEVVRHAGTERFHVLINAGQSLLPIYESQWIVRDSGTVEIYWDMHFKSRFEKIELRAPAEEIIGKFIQVPAKKAEIDNSLVTEVLKSAPSINGEAHTKKEEL